MSHNIQVEGRVLPTYLFDGYQVHRAALARGLRVLVLPRQVLLAGKNSTVPSEISFAHGVPEASTVAAVTYAQDRRLRRALLQRAGVQVPRGATFTWKSVKQAARWAERVGYPVVIKEVVGENPARAIRDVRDGNGLVAAFQTLRLREPGDRSPGSNPLIAGYSTTRLGYILDEDGQQIAPMRTRFLVEEQPVGETIRALVVGGELVAAVELDPAGQDGVRDVTKTLHRAIKATLLKAAEAIPGLAAAMLDVVVADHQQAPGAQGAPIVELSERPRADTFVAAEDRLGDLIGNALLEAQAKRAGLLLDPASEDIDTGAVIEGLRDAKATAHELPDAAREYGVRLSVTNHDEIEGVIQATYSGSASSIAIVTELLMAGLLVRDRAACVEYVDERA